MMYHQKLVVAVKCGGKVLREHGDTVYLPFGSEYSLLLKNLDPQRRAVVEVSIDGRDVVEGGLVINANSSVDLKRFVEDGNMNRGPAFKFVEMTDKIEEQRGVKAEDGLVQVTFRYENPIVYGGFIWRDDTWATPHWQHGTYYNQMRSMKVGSSVDSIGATQATYSAQVNHVTPTISTTECDMSFCDAAATCSLAANENGITVKGNEVKQKFTEVKIDESRLTAPERMILRLKGEVGQKRVAQPLSVRRNIFCSECGKRNPSTSRFCSVCGNNLSY